MICLQNMLMMMMLMMILIQMMKKLTDCHSDIDTKDEIIEDIDDDEIKDVIDKVDDKTDDVIEDMIEDNKERTRHLDMINKQIDHISLLVRLRNHFSKNIEEICKLMDELHDEIYSYDSWLMPAELNKINVLLDEVLDCLW